MLKTKLYGTLALSLLVGVAGCDRSDGIDANGEATAAGEQALMPQEMDPEVMRQITEIQELQQQLEPIQQAALQDDALAGELAGIQVQIETAMRNEDAEFFDQLDRLHDDMAAAEAAGDQERMQSLIMQAQGMEQEGQALQAAVFARPEIRERVEAFEAAHRARMIEIEPEAESLLDRIEEIMASLGP